jgi:hypothetical protein
MPSENRTAILACEIFRDELDLLAPTGTQLIYLRQSLHRTPQIMPGEIQAELDQIEPGSVDRVILAYGLARLHCDLSGIFPEIQRRARKGAGDLLLDPGLGPRKERPPRRHG